MSDLLFGNFGADLFREFDRLQRQMATFSGDFPSSLRSSPGAFPPVNIGATDDSIEVVLFAPGMSASQFDVSIDKGVLTIAGERKPVEAAGQEGSRFYARERFAGAFRRVIELPSNANSDDVQAKYTNGCLSIRIGKHESSKPRSITVQ